MPWLRALLFLLIGFLNTAVMGSVIVLLALFTLISPLRSRLVPCIHHVAEAWVWGNKNLLFAVIPPIRIDIDMPDDLKTNGWYLLLPNHQSWVDIILLFNIFHHRIPFLKFFLKYELIYIPFLGIACKALNMPFMKRYSKSYLEKHPEKKGEDLLNTRKACATFHEHPVAVVNFMEGTRRSPDKMKEQQSPYQHLLRPKAGGVAFVLSALGPSMQSALDVTLVYPDRVPSLADLACGRLRHVKIHVQECVIPADFRGRDYENDAQYRDRFQSWIGELWKAKDVRISSMLNS